MKTETFATISTKPNADLSAYEKNRAAASQQRSEFLAEGVKQVARWIWGGDPALLTRSSTAERKSELERHSENDPSATPSRIDARGIG